MKPTTTIPAARLAATLRPARSLPAVGLASSAARCAARCAAAQQRRSHATHHDPRPSDMSASKRRSITPFNDDGFVPWNELSAREKTARATQQTFNFGLVLVGLVLTGAVGYFMWTDVFAPDSKINHFNRAVDRIKKDARCVQVLGESGKITAHGEGTGNKWRRARPVASTARTDQQGNEHLVMHFHVDGPLGNGIAQLHAVRPRGQSDYEYRRLFLDVKGHDRIYLENATSSEKAASKRQLSLFGVKW